MVTVAATMVSEWMFARAAGAIFGFVLFGQPLTANVLELLAQIDTHWIEKLILKV